MLLTVVLARLSLLPVVLLAICAINSSRLTQNAVADVSGLWIYVATNGSDEWSGRPAEPNGQQTDGPFASIARARDEIRKTKKGGGLPQGGAAVVMRGGTYELDETLLLEAQDGGDRKRPVVYRAADGEKVRISGGCDIPSLEKVTDASVLARLDPTARGKVVSADLKKLGISDFGSAESSGNDHTIELNEIHHVCLESNDAGAIYAGRDWTMRGTVIRHNFLHHVTGFENRGCVGVYLDDMFCGTEISGNVFYKVTRAAFIGGGRDVTINNNVIEKELRFVDVAKMNFRLRSGSAVLKKLPDLSIIPFDKIGLLQAQVGALGSDSGYEKPLR